MKALHKTLIFVIIYALLSIPDNRESLFIPKKTDTTTNSKWWGKFAQNLVKFRITNEENQSYSYNKHRKLLHQHFDELQLQLTEPDNQLLDSISYHINKLSALASLMPNKIHEFDLDVSKWRKLLKYQSRYWDTSSKETNERLFRLLIESRLAFESALVQSDIKSISSSSISNDNNPTSKKIEKIQFKSGDLIAFNLASTINPYSAFIRELPNVYKHLGCIYIEDTSITIIYLDHEKGLKIDSIDNFLNKVAPNGIVLRLRDDIPILIKSPELPKLTASTINQMAKNGSYKYDYNFDAETQDYLYDWELINTVYKLHNLNLEPNHFIKSTSSIHLGSDQAHLKAFEIELDHRFIIAGEWHNSELLYSNRLLTAATSSIIQTQDNSYFINPLLLPIYRVVKAYSIIAEQIGINTPIPSGITAQTQLVSDALTKEQKNLVMELESELAKYEADQKHKATYLKILQKSDEITSGR